MKKRIWSLLLVVAMVAAMIPGPLQVKAENAYTTLSANETLVLTGETLWVDTAVRDNQLFAKGEGEDGTKRFDCVLTLEELK